MASPWQYALTVGPLGFYLWVLAVWQSGRHPRVVRGLVDFGLLAFGVGGALAFGPFGQLVTSALYRRPGPADRLVVAAILGLGACLLARKAIHRLVVYQVDPEDLAPALEDVLARLGTFARGLGGYEDRAARRGLRVETTRWLRCAVVEAYGHDPEGLIREVRPRLRQRLASVPSRPSRVAASLYGCAVFVMLAPVLALFLSQPRTREALRALIRRWQL
jgi:hypothetical protein